AQPSGCNPEISQRLDQAVFKIAEIASDIRLRPQIDDWIANQLSRPVIGDVATSIHVKAGDTARRQLGFGEKDMVPRATSSDGVGVRMLEQDQGIGRQSRAPGLGEAILQRPGRRVPHEPEATDLHDQPVAALAGTWLAAWYELRTSGPDSTCRKPSLRAWTFSAANSSGVT